MECAFGVPPGVSLELRPSELAVGVSPRAADVWGREGRVLPRNQRPRRSLDLRGGAAL